MIGIPGALSRLIKARRPADGFTDHEWMEVWLTPSRIPWDHRPNSERDGPFRLIRAATLTDAIFTFEDHAELVDALKAFCLRNLPTPEQRCSVTDRHHQMVLGWIDYRLPNVLEADEERYGWFGCEQVFRSLAVVHNDVDAAFWSRIANPEEA